MSQDTKKDGKEKIKFPSEMMKVWCNDCQKLLYFKCTNKKVCMSRDNPQSFEQLDLREVRSHLSYLLKIIKL